MFRHVVLILAFVALSLTKPSDLSKRLRPNGRIIGGDLVRIEDNPWQVSLQLFGSHNCGGVIISEDTLLTAGHCAATGFSGYYVIISGTADLLKNSTNSEIKKVIMHDNYTEYDYDVAIIQLTEPLVFDETTQAVPLADEDPVAGDQVLVTGWGILEENDFFTSTDLYGVNVTIVDRAECAQNYADFEDGEINESTICAGSREGGKDACAGDSGGPLTKNGVLVGLVSWGLGCARPEYPGVYASIASVRDWIRENSGV